MRALFCFITASVHNKAAIAVLASGVLILTGCETAKEAGEAVSEAGRNIVRAIGGPGSKPESPPDDGTACYAKERLAFYEAARRANESEEILNLGGAIAGTVLSSYSPVGYGNAFGVLIKQNFNKAVQQLQTGLRDDEQRIREFNKAFEALYECRLASAKQINADLRARRIDRNEAQRRMNVLRDLMNTDIQVARAINGEIRERTESFKVAAEQARKEAKAAPNAQARVERTEEVDKIDTSVQTNQRALQASVASVDQASAVQTQKEGGPFNLSGLWQRIRSYLGLA